jgi:GNAT superfamily N-acetyltransferase
VRGPRSAGIVVAPARPWQARRLTEIAFEAKRHWGYPEAWIRLWWDELVVEPQYLREQAAHVAMRAERIVGWIGASPVSGHWGLDHMWVEPAHMGLGVGAALLARVRVDLTARGVRSLAIVSDPNAGGFYERQGALRIGDAASAPAGRRIPVYTLAL